MRAPWTLTAGLAALAASAVLDLRIVGELKQRPYDVQHVPKGSFARLTSLGQRGLVSDLYWLSAVQYIGDSAADVRGWEKLYPLIDLVTDLDARHGYAYQTAGIVLSAAGRLDESDAILKKGIEKGPNWWTYPYYIAFNYWFYRGDYATGARWAEQAARTPGASTNISHLAVSLASKSGTPEDAIAMLLELRKNVRDEVSAAKLDEQLKLAFVERDAQMLERAAAEFTQRTGLPLVDLSTLVVAGLVTSLPRDPFGGQYEWDTEKQEVHSSVNPFRFRVREQRRRPEFHFKGPAAPAQEVAPR
jgi:tetratricopeptide (TPR) repeat protein